MRNERKRRLHNREYVGEYGDDGNSEGTNYPPAQRKPPLPEFINSRQRLHSTGHLRDIQASHGVLGSVFSTSRHDSYRHQGS